MENIFLKKTIFMQRNIFMAISIRNTALILFAFMVMLLLIAIGDAAAQDRQLYYDENGIKAFKRQHEKSSYLETKGIAIIKSRIEVVSQVLDDIAAYPKWMSDCIEAQLLESSDNRQIIYIAQHVPWPVTDRDVIVLAVIDDNWEQGKQTIVIQSIADYPGFTPVKDRIRMDKMTGKWELEYVDREHTRVTYTVFSEPGGFIPAAIANTSVKNVPSISLEFLKEMVKEPKYIALANTSTHKKIIEKSIQEGLLSE